MRFRRGGRRRRRGTSRLSLGQVRLVLLGGTFAGLLAFQTISSSPPWPQAEIESDSPPPSAVDPYVESRLSRAILEGQEGSPTPLEADHRSGSSAVVLTDAVRVIDGDTFIHAGARIRIADIDTPEVQGRCPEEIALAAQATRRLDQLLAQGAIELHPLPGGRDEDRYGRKLRIVTLGGRSIGDVLVAEGLARTWTGRREPWCG